MHNTNPGRRISVGLTTLSVDKASNDRMTNKESDVFKIAKIKIVASWLT
jgi:hypothetical protein